MGWNGMQWNGMDRPGGGGLVICFVGGGRQNMNSEDWCAGRGRNCASSRNSIGGAEDGMEWK